MSEFHRLDAATDARFLRARVEDSLTKTPFRPTNEVVLCRTCGLVSLRETWEAVGGCPNGHDTPARWDERRALAAGDGAATLPPRSPRPVAAPPEPQKNRWLLPALLALLVGGGLVAAVVFGGLLGDEEVVEEVDPAPAAPTGPEAINVAEPGLIEGALDTGDFLEDGRYRDLYTFAADSSGRVLTFRASSEDFFPDLLIETPEGDRVEAETVERDDDTGRVTVRVADLRGPGLYRILLSSRQPEETGEYALRIVAEVPTRPLTPGGSAVTATLGELSENVEGFFLDRYRFSGAADREHTITVRSSAFAPTVRLQGPSGNVRGETGRAGGVVTFVFTPGASGTHTLIVSSQSPAKRGAYSVQLAVGPAPPAPEREVVVRRTLPTNGTPVSDSLAAGDTQSYTIRGRVGDRIRLEVRSNDFTPSLTLVAPDGSRLPATPDGDRARLRETLAAAGTFRVIVGASGGDGTYRLTLEQQAAVSADDIPRLPGADQPRNTPIPTEESGGDGEEEYEPQPIGDGGTPSPDTP